MDFGVIHHLDKLLLCALSLSSFPPPSPLVHVQLLLVLLIRLQKIQEFTNTQHADRPFLDSCIVSKCKALFISFLVLSLDSAGSQPMHRILI